MRSSEPDPAGVIGAPTSAAGMQFALVVASWHEEITRLLAQGAVDALVRRGAERESIAQWRVPGSYEIPLAAQELCRSGAFEGVVALGCVLRGETVHFDLIAEDVTEKLSTIALQTGVPVGHGVVAAETKQQALERAGGPHGNKGAEAALAALDMAHVLRDIRARRRTSEPRL